MRRRFSARRFLAGFLIGFLGVPALFLFLYYGALRSTESGRRAEMRFNRIDQSLCQWEWDHIWSRLPRPIVARPVNKTWETQPWLHRFSAGLRCLVAIPVGFCGCLGWRLGWRLLVRRRRH